jgi:hypothetical protein
VAWTLGDLEVKLPEEEAAASKEPGIYQPRPEISHLFRSGTLGIYPILYTVLYSIHYILKTAVSHLSR